MVYAQDGEASRAAQMMQAGDFPGAEHIWRQLAKSHPLNAIVHANLGVVLAQENKLAEAVTEYRRSLQLKPNQPEVQSNLAIAEFKQGHFENTIGVLKQVAKQKLDDQRSTILIGMSYYGLHQYQQAAEFLRTAVQHDPSNLELKNVLAQSCLWSRHYDCAMAQFKDMLAINPESAQAHMLLAEALDGMGKTDEAIQELEDTARSSPREPVLHFELGYLYYKQGEYDKASSELQTELANNPGYAQAYVYLGDIAFRTNNDEAAQKYLNKALGLEPASRLAHFDTGCIYMKQGKNQEAIGAFRRAIELDPSQPDAHYRLARVYSAMGQNQQAAKELAKTKQLHQKADDSLIEKISGERGRQQ